jgi:LPXTG-motif cell wall-anchored protein
MIGTTVGGGMVGAGIQRTYMAGNRIASGFSKLIGKSSFKFDQTTWVLLIGGIIMLGFGVAFSLKKK